MFKKISAIFTAISSKPLAGFLSTEYPCLLVKKLFFRSNGKTRKVKQKPCNVSIYAQPLYLGLFSCACIRRERRRPVIVQWHRRSIKYTKARWKSVWRMLLWMSKVLWIRVVICSNVWRELWSWISFFFSLSSTFIWKNCG